MDGQTEWTYSQSCLWSQLKNVKLNRDLPVDTKHSFSYVPYILWYSCSHGFRPLYKILLMAFQMCSIRRPNQAMVFDSI